MPKMRTTFALIRSSRRMTMKRKTRRKYPAPYGFQSVGIWRAVHKFKGRVLITDELGLGKTLQALHIAMQFRVDGRPIIVVCPNSVKYGWEVEVHKHTGLECWVLQGTTPPIRKPLHLP